MLFASLLMIYVSIHFSKNAFRFSFVNDIIEEEKFSHKTKHIWFNTWALCKKNEDKKLKDCIKEKHCSLNRKFNAYNQTYYKIHFQKKNC